MIRTLTYAAAILACSAPASAHMMQYGSICQTQYGWCRLPGTAPLGSRCYCATPQGAVYGVVR
jgi:hypothetical protein